MVTGVLFSLANSKNAELEMIWFTHVTLPAYAPPCKFGVLELLKRNTGYVAYTSIQRELLVWP